MEALRFGMMLMRKPRLLGFMFLILTRMLLLSDSRAAALTPPETGSRESTPSIDLKSPPLNGNAPITVQVGLYIMELPMVNEAALDAERKPGKAGWRGFGSFSPSYLSFTA